LSFQQNAFQQNAFQIEAPGGGPVSIGWFQPFSDPVRVNPVARYGAALAASGLIFLHPVFSPTVLDASPPPASGPVFTKVVQYQSSAFVFAPGAAPVETITVDKWFQPLSEPVRKRPKVAFDTFHAFQPTPIIKVDWFQPLSEPTRRKRVQTQQFHAFQPTPIIKMDWFQPLSEPTRTLRGKMTLHISGAAYLTPVFDPPVFSVTALSSGASFFREFQYQAYAFKESLTPPPPEVVTVDKWYMPLSEPVRLKVGLEVKLQQTLAQGSVNELFERSPSTGPLYIRSRGGSRTTFWKGRTVT
jgi:hypothetical protein